LWERERDLGGTNGLIKRFAPLADAHNNQYSCSQQDDKKHGIEYFC
jgi:hypothetical protein